ncbi:UNVERIFIED_CONTAM: hypothetical protein DES50_103478 [Williamsia faeni]
MTPPAAALTVVAMTNSFGNLLNPDAWFHMPLDQQGVPSYFWKDGGLLNDAPVDFAATFADHMDLTSEPIDLMHFNRNPLRVTPGFVVPKHQHNCDEMLFVFAGEYSIEVDEPDGSTKTVVVRAGDMFVSHANTPYTMTAGPEGVTYIETWPVPVTELETIWHDVGWVHR